MNAYDKRILQFKGGEIEVCDTVTASGSIISNSDDDRIIYVDEPLDLFLIGKEFPRIALLKDPSINPFNNQRS